MNGIQMQLGNLPIAISLFLDATVSFSPIGKFSTIIDSPDTGCQAIISNEDIYIGATTLIEYGVRYPYKEMGELLAWLSDQKLIMPDLN